MNSNQMTYKSLKLFSYYAIICTFLKWIAMYRDIRNGVIVAIFIVIFVCIMIANEKFVIKISNSVSKVAICFLIYNIILSFVSYARGYSISLIFSEAANTLVPIALYFIAIKLDEKQANRFESVVMISGIEQSRGSGRKGERGKSHARI